MDNHSPKGQVYNILVANFPLRIIVGVGHLYFIFPLGYHPLYWSQKGLFPMPIGCYRGQKAKCVENYTTAPLSLPHLCFSVLSLSDPPVFNSLPCCFFANNLHFISGLEPLRISAILKCNCAQINYLRRGQFFKCFWFEFEILLLGSYVVNPSILGGGRECIRHPSSIASDERAVVMSQSFFLCTADLAW